MHLDSKTIIKLAVARYGGHENDYYTEVYHFEKEGNIADEDLGYVYFGFIEFGVDTLTTSAIIKDAYNKTDFEVLTKNPPQHPVFLTTVTTGRYQPYWFNGWRVYSKAFRKRNR